MSDERPFDAGEVFNEAAPTYDTVLPMFAHFGALAVVAAQLRPGDRVLDVAIGRGSTLFPALEKVGAGGEVIGIDIAPEMVRLTAEDIRRRGITNARVSRMDGRELDFPDASFDVVICAFMIFLIDEPERALAEISRVLRPGGSLTLATWVGNDARWNWMGPATERLADFDARSWTDPYAEEGSLPRALQAAGLEVTRTEEAEKEFHLHDVDHWFEYFRSHGGIRLMRILEAKPGALEAFRAVAEEETARFSDRDGIPFEQRARFTLARKPG